MRAALLDDQNFVINVVEVGDLNVIPNLIAAETAGNISDWWNGTEFIIIWDPRHPKYTGPYVPPQ